MNVRGVIEGFYGPPWTHVERLDLLGLCGRHELNTWVHAAKDDPYHRLWRDPYPEDELDRLAELVRAAERHGVELAWAIAPGLSICYSDGGVRCPGDRERYGAEPSPSAAAQADLSNRFRREFLDGAALVVCPMGYAGVGRTTYRATFARLLDPEIVVYWTGPDVVPESITREDLDGAVAAFGHELLLWDDYPVNDFDPGRLFLGPLRGRDGRLADGRLAGMVANGMLQAVPSKLPLATVSDFAGDPAGYRAEESYERALSEYCAEVVEALRVLVPTPAPVQPPPNVATLVEALAPGVDAATALALLGPFA